MVTVDMHCGNPECLEKEFVLQNQPEIDDLRTGAGNLLLSFAILMAGASASKVLRVLSHMRVACFSLRQFFRHPKVSIIGCLPTRDPTNLFLINIFIHLDGFTGGRRQICTLLALAKRVLKWCRGSDKAKIY